MTKKDYSPLLTDGFKTISIYQLDKYFLDPFGTNERRKYLISRFMAFIRQFSKLAIRAEVWIDGSFTTIKEDPGDVDLLFVTKKQEIDALTGNSAVLFQQLMVNSVQIQERYNCDIHFIDENDQELRAKYLLLFGRDRTELNSKGIFVIYLTGTPIT